MVPIKYLSDVRLHVFSLKGVPMQLPQPFNSDVRNGMTGRVKVLGYRFAAVVADVGQMLRETNREGPGSLTNMNEVTRLTELWRMSARCSEKRTERDLEVSPT